MKVHGDKPAIELFQAAPGLFLENSIKEHVASSPGNRLPAFGDEPIFGEPLVGFADGDAPIFQDYKDIIGGFHLTPREALTKYRLGKGNPGKEPIKVSVISFVLPFTYETKLSMHQETIVPSLRWNHARFQGQDFIKELSRYVSSLLEGLGFQAVNPELTDFYEVKDWPTPPGRASNWSHKHIAYAAGLGSFGLNGVFISRLGTAMRCGSVVTDAPLPISPRASRHHMANCLFYKDGSCRRCIERCPVGAISEQGLDKKKCREFLQKEQGVILKQLGRENGYIGPFPACGFCMTKVPCEDKIPPGITIEE